VEGLQPLSDRYDLVLCDIWGVLHNGVKAYAPASDALIRFRDRGGLVVLVSNAPRPGASVATQLDGFGVPAAAYDAIVTSGDLTRIAVEARAGEIVHHMGPERDLPLFKGLDLRFGSVEEAAISG
jgi:ribonucleotide monophosphatase NagD (HAD superfamily)